MSTSGKTVHAFVLREGAALVHIPNDILTTLGIDPEAVTDLRSEEARMLDLVAMILGRIGEEAGARWIREQLAADPSALSRIPEDARSALFEGTAPFPP